MMMMMSVVKLSNYRAVPEHPSRTPAIHIRLWGYNEDYVNVAHEG